MRKFDLLHWFICVYVALGPFLLTIGYYEPGFIALGFTLILIIQGWRPWHPGLK